MTPMPQSGRGSGAEAARASASSQPSVRATSPKREKQSDSATSERPMSAWNAFQHQYQGRNWGTEKMRAEYWRYKATGKKPA